MAASSASQLPDREISNEPFWVVTKRNRNQKHGADFTLRRRHKVTSDIICIEEILRYFEPNTSHQESALQGVILQLAIDTPCKMSSRISQLAETIEQNTATIEEYLQSKGIPSPSLGYDAPKALATTGDAEALRIQTISAANELSDLLKGPAELIRYDWTEHASLRLILRLGIPSMVPLGSDSQVSFSELAQRTALPERDVRRILRHGMCRHIFTEPRKGYVSHTAISRLLREDEQQVAIASTVADVLEPALLHTADAVQKFPGSEEARESAFSLVNSPGKSM